LAQTSQTYSAAVAKVAAGQSGGVTDGALALGGYAPAQFYLAELSRTARRG
jgi:hypothetical protein